MHLRDTETINILQQTLPIIM